MAARAIFLILIFSLASCNNFGLLEKLENPGSTGKRYAFVSSLATNGNMSGLSNGGCTGGGTTQADCSCNDLAQAAGRKQSSSSRFVAWLSTLNDDMTCRINGKAGNNCQNSGGPSWYNTRDQVIATGYSDLFDSNLTSQVKYTESGMDATALNVWSGTDANGLRSLDTGSVPGGADATCTNWTVNTSSGTKGDVGSNGATWSAGGSTSCATSTVAVYCFEVP
jgi:hypothetical protein